MNSEETEIIRKAIAWIQVTFDVDKTEAQERFERACQDLYLGRMANSDKTNKKMYIETEAAERNIVPEEWARIMLAKDIHRQPLRNNYLQHIARLFLAENLNISYDEADNRLNIISRRLQYTLLLTSLRDYGYTEKEFLDFSEKNNGWHIASTGIDLALKPYPSLSNNHFGKLPDNISLREFKAQRITELKPYDLEEPAILFLNERELFLQDLILDSGIQAEEIVLSSKDHWGCLRFFLKLEKRERQMSLDAFDVRRTPSPDENGFSDNLGNPGR